MPKVFLTGSGANKGYHTGSGITSLPARVTLRNKDNQSGQFSYIKRTGDADRLGRGSIFFNDRHTQVFGKRIFDSFDSSTIDSSKWEFSAGMFQDSVSFTSTEGVIINEGLVVFRFSRNTGERWIQTKEKVKNPIVKFSLISGPLEDNSGTSGLKLVAGSSDDVLKFQASLDGTTWIDIETYSPPVDKTAELSKILPCDRLEALKNKQKIPTTSFSHGSLKDQYFYLRWVQPDVSSTRKMFPVWAISQIYIRSNEQLISLGVGTDDTSFAGLRAHNSFVSTPSSFTRLYVTGSTVSGVSDSNLSLHQHHNNFETISPFYETLVVEKASKRFYAEGTSPLIYPGLGFPTRDKTKISISLNQGQDNFTNFGYVVPTSTADPANETSNKTQPLMVYWDNETKQWENYVLFSPIDASATSPSDINNYLSTAKGVGFGPIGVVATSSVNDGDITAQFGKNVLSNYVRPVKTFGFPFASAFEIESNKCIKMSNYLNDPFVLEKVVVEFPAYFEFAAPSTPSNADNHNSLTYSTNETAGPYPSKRLDDAHKVMIPTFFILNQKMGEVIVSQSISIDKPESPKIEKDPPPPTGGVSTLTADAVGDPTAYSSDDGKTYDIELEEAIEKLERATVGTTTTPSYGSESQAALKTVRELVTYSQMTMFASSSSGSKIDLEATLLDGLSRDNSYNILELNGQTGWDNSSIIEPFSGSFVIEAPCRISPRTDDTQRVQIRQPNVGAGVFRVIYLDDEYGGRGTDIIDTMNRALVNGAAAARLGTIYTAPGPDRDDLPVPIGTVDNRDIDQVSPYVILPGDNLIFGWQYPVAEEAVPKMPGSLDSKKNLMRLFGETKVYLYGSLLRDNYQVENCLNQNLDTANIYETVGNERVLDQFVINNRNEYTGSFIDTINYKYSSALGTYFPIDSISVDNGPTGRVSDDLDFFAGSVTNLKPYGYPSSFNKYRGISERSSLLVGYNFSGDKELADANKDENSLWFDYGTLQNYKTGANKLKHKKAKFYFNHNHFGYYSDLYRQGRDSRFGVGFPSSVSVESPIKIQFVSGSFEPNAIAFYKSRGKTPAEIIADSNSQSSNMSLYATSSLPFFDHPLQAYNR